GREPGGASADHHDVVVHAGRAHPIASPMSSTTRRASSWSAAPSTHDVTTFVVAPQRLKNTPIPGRGSTAGTWYAFRTRHPKMAPRDAGKSETSAQLNENVSPPAAQGRERRIIESGRCWRKS